MPAGKQLGKFDGKFTSIRVLKVRDDNSRVLEASYSAGVTGELAGTAKGTMTFDGRAENGVLTDRGFGIFASGEAVNAKGQGVYWGGADGTWEIRGAFKLGEQMVVSEGQVIMDGQDVLLKGNIFALT